MLMAGTAVVMFRGKPDDEQVLAAMRQIVGDDTESDGRIILTVQRRPRPLGYGPGTELKRMLGRIGIKAEPGCKCTARAEEMDRRGCDWCEANVPTIVGWLREEAKKRGLPFLDAAAGLLVRRAIHNARSKHGTQANAETG
jgi:hypothetical protein